jgi:hypothetical protein
MKFQVPVAASSNEFKATFMKAQEPKLPYGISEYITDHFREDFLFEVRETKLLNGHWYYIVEVTKDNYTHTLKFNDAGELIEEQADQTFPPEDHDEPASGDVQE